MTTTDRSGRRKRPDSPPAEGVARRPRKAPRVQPDGEAKTRRRKAPAQPEPVDRRVYVREPRVWEDWEPPLKRRLVAKRIVRWFRLRMSRPPESDSPSS